MTAATTGQLGDSRPQDERSELLTLLWRVGLAGAAVMTALLVAAPSMGGAWYAAPAVICLCSILMRHLVRRGSGGGAAWVWVGLNGVAVMAPIVLLSGSSPQDPVGRLLYEVIPYNALLVILVSGMLLPARAALLVVGLQALGTVMWPFYRVGSAEATHVAAFVLSVIAAGVVWVVGGAGRASMSAGSGARSKRTSEELASVRDALTESEAARRLLSEQVGGLRAAVSRQSAALRAAIEVSALSAATPDRDSLLQSVVATLSTRFDVSAALYLVEEDGAWLRLTAVHGAHALPISVGERVATSPRSLLGASVLERRAKAAADVRSGMTLLDHVAPAARAEATFPLIAQGQLLGALDLQSPTEGAFGDEDMVWLAGVADQIAGALSAVRGAIDAQDARRELAALQRRYVRESWDPFTPQLEAAGYRYRLDGVSALGHRPLPEVSEAVERGRTVVEPTRKVVAPITLRGRAIGALGIEDPGGERRWTEEEVHLIESVARQMSVVLDNARLLEEMQRRLGEISDLNRRYVRDAWTEYLPGSPAGEYVYAQPGVRRTGPRREQVEEALSRRAPVSVAGVGEGEPESALVAPIQLREQILGALGLEEVGENRQWSTDDVELIDAVASQMSWAIENARLFEETERRAAELASTAEKLRETDQFRAQFLANMSHELRTPLNSIIGFSRVILRGIDGPLTELQRTDLEAIYTNGQHLLLMINEILDMSKIEAGGMDLILEDLDLVELVQSAVSSSTALTKDRPIEMRVETEGDLPTVRADGTRIRQVMANLLSNASKFTHEGEIRVRVWLDGDLVYVSVADTGEGIEEDKIALAFEPFRQVDGSSTRRAEGTGLGLPISRELVEMHGGRIWLESEYGSGTTVAFYLPVEGPAEVIPELDGRVIAQDKRVVLAVGRDEQALALIADALPDTAYEVIALAEPFQAARWARHLHPWAILLELEAGDDGAWEALERLKAGRATRDCPVIACCEPAQAPRAITLGASSHIRLPVEADQVAGVMGRLQR